MRPFRDVPFFITFFLPCKRHHEADKMTMQIQQLLVGLDQFAPFSLAEEWDNVGLLVGNPEATVTSILLGLDPTIELLGEAILLGANTIITHHPCIFNPLTSIHTNTPAGIFLEKALSHKINIIACHTNLDNAASGVSDALAEALGLTSLSPLCPSGAMTKNSVENSGTGTGRIGSFDPPLPASTFMTRLFHTLQLSSIQIAGKVPELVRIVALCGGSGSELAKVAQTRGADLYLSAEIKHSTARWAQECGFCIIDGSHYGTEQPVLPVFCRKIQELAASNNWSIDVFLTQSEKKPFKRSYQNNFK